MLLAEIDGRRRGAGWSAHVRHLLLGRPTSTPPPATALLDTADRLRAGPAGPRGAQAADAARPHRDHDVLRELDAHPGVVRGRGQVDERGHRQRQRVGVVGGARGSRCATPRSPSPPMGADCVIVRHPASGARRTGSPRGSTRTATTTGTPTVGRQRGRRHPRAPHPGAAGRGHAARPARRHRREAGRDRRRRPAQPGRALQRASCSRRSAPRSCWSRRRRCCPSGWRSGPVG